MSEHLQTTRTDRGFAHMPAIPGAYGGEATVYESSAASSPHIWLNVRMVVTSSDRNAFDVTDATLHLTTENATKLSEQLAYLVANHYQIKEST